MEAIKGFINWSLNKMGVKSKVLLFLDQPNPRKQRQKLRVFLLPRNIPLDEVSAQQRYSENIQVPSECELREDQSYTLDCPQAIKIQPESAQFDLEFGPNYYPTFEVRLEPTTEKVTLTVKDQKQVVVWESDVDLTDARRKTPRMSVSSEDDVPADKKLFSIRSQFVERVSESVLNQLLDKLLDLDVIKDEEMQLIKTKPVKQEKARELIDTVRIKGTIASSILIAALCEVDPHLSRQLHFSSGPSVATLHHQIKAGPSTSETNIDVSEDIREESKEDEEDQSCPDDPERLNQQPQLLCGDVPNTNDKQNFKPELRNESRKTSYRFRCPGPGVFQCELTGLVFVMVQEAELLYRTVQWDESLFRSADKMAAGLLFDIKCSKDTAVRQLHLPHCEVKDAPLPEGLLSVVHITGDKMNFLEPLEITVTHVVVTVSHFSFFGLMKDCKKRLPNKRRKVKSKVLLFPEQPNQELQKQRLNVFLLPWTLNEDEVIPQQQYSEEIQVTSECELIKDQSYTLDCPQAIKVQPKRAKFDVVFGPKYYPKFHVDLPTTTEEVTLMVKDRSETVAWQYDFYPTDARRRTVPMYSPAEDDVPADKNLLSIREKFVEGVSEPKLRKLMDKLLCLKIIDDEEMQSVRTEPTKQEKARKLIDTVRYKGPDASSRLITAICEVDESLSRHLKRSQRKM